MQARRVNFEYLNLYQEIPLFCALSVESFFHKKPPQKTGRILVVNTCLIGEFAASLPAVRDFIVRNGEYEVDLMVSPPLKPIAERVRGVRRVYTARSLYGRRAEETPHAEQEFGAYDKIFVMRISPEVYRLLRTIPAGEVHTALGVYSGYGLHLSRNLLVRQTPTQWRELNFKMLGGVPREIPFDELFEFTHEEKAAVAALEPLQTAERKVIVHTGASWVMKFWPVDRWVALLKKVHELGDINFIFVGKGEKDAEDYAYIAARLGFPTYSLIGKVDTAELTLVMRASDYFIGVDGGPMNVAHLADLRSMALFGPGPHFYLPYDSRDIALDKTRGGGVLQMFIARKEGYIHQITVDEAYEAFKKLWNS